ncbi:uncharacterized protein BCR38DRAFT_420209 [Pseudomassariella vexata]|uniref:Uncharacterized protein n=1 Tax=Pseudomassariella vexata TaxID=1141098 RepID=A0A1Y2EEK0_9PEZI|nr:uncharacterized protein BCR38DRAFT_420209 [Pseudomassariella vexata]ORY69837.1 hypothetical protein BCR38DRAFT_420209 [Pseudomassariella vexata]
MQTRLATPPCPLRGLYTILRALAVVTFMVVTMQQLRAVICVASGTCSCQFQMSVSRAALGKCEREHLAIGPL